MVGSSVHLHYGCDEMTDIVERLRDWMTIDQTTSPASRMAEAAYEIESLRKQLAEVIDECGEYACENNGLKQQLAECQARENVLRDALESAFGNEYWRPDNAPRVIIQSMQKALTLPSDSTALDEALRKAEERVEASYKLEIELLREIEEMLEPVEYSGSYVDGIKAALKQAKREALLEAAKLFDDQADREATNSVRRIAFLNCAEWLRRMAKELE